MEEALRESYLKAMGIEIWRQRIELPVVPVELREKTAAEPSSSNAGAGGEVAGDAMAFGVAIAAPDLCVLFESAEGDTASLQMVRDLLQALGGEVAGMRVAQLQGVRGTAAQGEESSARQLKELVRDRVRRMVLLGERADALLPLATRETHFAGTRFCATHGLAAMRAEPLLKREAWGQLREMVRRK